MLLIWCLCFSFLIGFSLQVSEHFENLIRVKRDDKKNNRSCILPDHPKNGEWTLLGGKIAVPGDKAELNTILAFSCDKQFALSSQNKFIVCVGEIWTDTPPTCLKLCPPFISSEITKVTCYDKNREVINCNATTHGSSAIFECAIYHELTDGIRATRFCSNGLWNYPPPRCIPVCGEKSISLEPLILDTHRVPKGSYPWVAAVYHNVSGIIRNTCGGTMITQKIIITAAHCVTNEVGTPLSPDRIKIGIGNYYNAYKDVRDPQAQYTDITKVLVPSRFRGESQRYASDIALLITKDHLVLSKFVRPVCYQDISHMNLTVGTKGVIAAWGYTEPNGHPSDELKEMTVKYSDETTCISKLSKQWTDLYLTYDKMCAEHNNKSKVVCKGDSGAGLAFPNKYGKYYIHGILSVGTTSEQIDHCLSSALYTKVALHSDWLELITSTY